MVVKQGLDRWGMRPRIVFQKGLLENTDEIDGIISRSSPTFIAIGASHFSASWLAIHIHPLFAPSPTLDRSFSQPKVSSKVSQNITTPTVAIGWECVSRKRIRWAKSCHRGTDDLVAGLSAEGLEKGAGQTKLPMLPNRRRRPRRPRRFCDMNYGPETKICEVKGIVNVDPRRGCPPSA